MGGSGGDPGTSCAAEAKGRIVVLGVGNILLRDEGAGVRALQRLEARYLFPPEVELIDGGVLGLNLMAVLEGAQRVIVLDCVRGGKKPGELHLFDFAEIPPRVRYKDSLHQLDLVETMSLLPLTGEAPPTWVVGIEPDSLDPWGMELSPAVEAGLEGMIQAVLEELRRLGVEPVQREEEGPAPAV